MLSKNYLFIKIRTNRKYILFLLFQLLLSFLIAILGLTSSSHFRSLPTLALEIVICLCITFDLVIRINSQSHFFRSKGNLLDVLTYFSLLILVVYMSASPIDDVVLQTDDLLIISVIIFRYAVQILRLGFMIRNSVDNIQMQKEMKDIDLNVPPVVTSKTATDEHGSQWFRNKMMDYVFNGKEEEGKAGEVREEDISAVPHQPLQEVV